MIKSKATKNSKNIQILHFYLCILHFPNLSSEILSRELIFRLNNPEFIPFTEKANGLALKFHAEHLVNLCEYTALTTALDFIAVKSEQDTVTIVGYLTNKFPNKKQFVGINKL